MAITRKFGRKSAHRKMMLRNLTTQVLMHKQIQTTLPKAKETRKMVEKMITLGKKGDLAARRKALSYILDEDIVRELFNDIAPKYKERNGGYTRIMKLGVRKGDNAQMSIIELV